MFDFIKNIAKEIKYFFNITVLISDQLSGYTEAENKYKKDLEANNPDAKKIYDAKIKKLEKEADTKTNNTERGNFDAYHQFVENNRRASERRYEAELPGEEQFETDQSKEKDDFLKTKGDRYERYIGEKFEEQGDLVIYNGFISGYKDQGVDIITVSQEKKVINLVQCKNWTSKQMSLEDVEDIYLKLDNFNWNFIQFLEVKTISEHLKVEVKSSDIWDVLYDVKEHREAFKIRKTLYASSDKVIDLDIGQNLTMIKPNIFRYEDMKVVIHSDDYVD